MVAERKGRQDGGDRRRVVYCVVPRGLAGALHEPLRAHYREDASVRVVVERRGAERRDGQRRATPAGTTSGRAAPASERRRIRGVEGRRVGERRALTVPVEAAPLPRKARRHADQLVFVERLEPSLQDAQDADSHRLVIRFQAGDHSAMSDLYLRHFDSVYGYARVATRNPHAAEDITQDVFMRAFKALPRYELRSGKPFRAWLFRITRNVVLNALSKDRLVSPESPSEIDLRRDEETAEATSEVLGWLSDPELILFVERLPDLQRQVLVLRYMFDLSTQDIATVVDRTPKAVRKAHSRALLMLERRLSAIGRDTPRTRRTPMRVRCRSLPVLAGRRFALGDATLGGPSGGRRPGLGRS